ncbi:hypothetical protein [Allofournierella sp.]|uniref:hypothetical protein n=1 Tax=Allofournierella sp. TaxID=1940256 RepID=UPI003AF1888F
MGDAFRAPGGGLPGEVRALLIPENIRAGVHIKGGGMDVTGEYITPVEFMAYEAIVEGSWSGRAVIYNPRASVALRYVNDGTCYLDIKKDFWGFAIAAPTGAVVTTIPLNTTHQFKSGESYRFDVVFSGRRVAVITVLNISN